MKQIGNILYADKGKDLIRKEDGFNYGDTIALGLSYYIGGQLLEHPHEDKAEDFKEIEQEKNT